MFRNCLLLFVVTTFALYVGCSGYEPEENFEVKPSGTETTITKYKGTAMEVKIPPQIDGRKVTEIGSAAFRNSTGLVKVVIPNTVKKIEYYAFEGCTGLESIDIPNTVKEISGDAFEGCTGLESIDIPDSVTRISFGAFENCTKLESIKLPKNKNFIRIQSDLFKNCSSLKSIHIPEGVKYIENAFRGCTSLETMFFPESFEDFDLVFGEIAPNLKKVRLSKKSKIRIINSYLNHAKTVPEYNTEEKRKEFAEHCYKSFFPDGCIIEEY